MSPPDPADVTVDMDSEAEMEFHGRWADSYEEWANAEWAEHYELS
jgi:hypothetical protein